MSNLDAYDFEDVDAKLNSAVIVGATTPKTCRLWVRVYMPGKWWLVVTENYIAGDPFGLGGMEVPDYLASGRLLPTGGHARCSSNPPRSVLPTALEWGMFAPPFSAPSSNRKAPVRGQLMIEHDRAVLGCGS